MKKIMLWALVGAIGCAGGLERQGRRTLEASELRPRSAEAEPPPIDGSLQTYLIYAMSRSPELRADFERWRAAIERIAVARRLPAPTLSFGVFLRSVETRVGPQRLRLSIRQSFPWPTRLSAASDAAAHRARAAEARLEGRALALRHRVAEIYWRLWLVERVHRLKIDQEDLLEMLTALVRGRIETGQADLAELAQVELLLDGHRDHHGVHAEARIALEAELRAAIGAPAELPTPITDAAPPFGLPAASAQTLLGWVLAHPRLARLERLAQAADAAADAEDALRYPSLGLGLDWIETGEAADPSMPQSGLDPLIVSVSVSLPIWGGYGAGVEAARADAAAERAGYEALALEADAALRGRLAQLRDTRRRALLHRDLLVPRGLSAWEATLGAYQVGRSGIAAILLVQRDLLAHQIALEQARIEHALGWAALEDLVGRELEIEGGSGWEAPAEEPMDPAQEQP